MNKKISNDVIVIELPIEQFTYLKKVTEFRDIDCVFDKNELSIHIIVPGISAIDIQIKVENIIPTNDEISAELCTPEECLSPGRNLLSANVLDQIIKEDNYISLISSLSKIMASVIDSSSYNIHLGLKAFELLIPFLLKQIDNDTDLVYYILNVPELRNTRFVIDETIDPVLAIVKHEYSEKKLWASSLAKD
jgi:hypothetical protein